MGYQVHKFLERFSTKENESAMYKHLAWLIHGIQEGERTNPGVNHFETPHHIKP